MNRKQKVFDEFYRKTLDFSQPIADLKEIVFSLYHIYITSNDENVKGRAAILINRLDDRFQSAMSKFDLLDVEYYTLLITALEKEKEQSMVKQKRRHEKRDDFAMTYEQWEEAINHFGKACAYCGKERKLTYDHFVPFSQGGGFKPDNIIPCCGNCNSGKCDKVFEEWYTKQPFFSEERKRRILDYIRSKKGDEEVMT